MQLVSKLPTYVITVPLTSQTDGRTDGRHAVARPRFACTIVHRAVKIAPVDRHVLEHS